MCNQVRHSRSGTGLSAESTEFPQVHIELTLYQQGNCLIYPHTRITNFGYQHRLDKGSGGLEDQFRPEEAGEKMPFRIRVDGIELGGAIEALRRGRVPEHSSLLSGSPDSIAPSLIFGRHSVAVCQALNGSRGTGVTTSELATVLNVRPKRLASLLAEWRRAAEAMGVDFDSLVVRKQGRFQGMPTSWYHLTVEGRRVFRV